MTDQTGVSFEPRPPESGALLIELPGTSIGSGLNNTFYIKKILFILKNIIRIYTQSMNLISNDKSWFINITAVTTTCTWENKI